MQAHLDAAQPDQRWLDDNVGRWLYEMFGHQLIMVLDEARRPVQAWRDGALLADPTRDAGVQAILASLQLRAAAGDGASRPRRRSRGRAGDRRHPPRCAGRVSLHAGQSEVSRRWLPRRAGGAQPAQGTTLLQPWRAAGGAGALYADVADRRRRRLYQLGAGAAWRGDVARHRPLNRRRRAGGDAALPLYGSSALDLFP
nr:CHASE4 domain-containing protein [Pantoea sp. NGS-ED-1003]